MCGTDGRVVEGGTVRSGRGRTEKKEDVEQRRQGEGGGKVGRGSARRPLGNKHRAFTREASCRAVGSFVPGSEEGKCRRQTEQMIKNVRSETCTRCIYHRITRASTECHCRTGGESWGSGAGRQSQAVCESKSGSATVRHNRRLEGSTLGVADGTVLRLAVDGHASTHPNSPPVIPLTRAAASQRMRGRLASTRITHPIIFQPLSRTSAETSYEDGSRLRDGPDVQWRQSMCAFFVAGKSTAESQIPRELGEADDLRGSGRGNCMRAVRHSTSQARNTEETEQVVAITRVQGMGQNITLLSPIPLRNLHGELREGFEGGIGVRHDNSVERATMRKLPVPGGT
ncbi:hypothetical protein GLOTRDRAFT_95341 [Gloeophyllum trabeum ATCC 11539]|uniref:Uncharacterized protein n=1 Tax=Gloeophyllum trabeum (strain ATCC 11539 / FP-39264 / Madison 617) TaxID=670483 RepID=S7RIJ2_GLOTA|nr:uncharacterized protein GLOTRDRAFT_95341 [Gloeophyllum trabeum ATCC 11539]EPQ52414.1 hypothetical protein GLOTRDRAFT_95341 [Gloeophyllum trabeum ATCC 11539]